MGSRTGRRILSPIPEDTSTVSNNNHSRVSAANSQVSINTDLHDHSKKAKSAKVSGTPSRISLPRAAKTPSREASPVERDPSPARGSPTSNMSTRRSARATSRAASEVSAANSAITPRRSTRSTALPKLGTKASNAYGTNAVVGAGQASGPQVAEQITGVIDDLLEIGMSSSVSGNRSTASSNRSSRAGSRAFAPDRAPSYYNESGLFGGAHLESSLQSRELSMIEEERFAPRQAAFNMFALGGQGEQREKLEEAARVQRIPQEEEEEAVPEDEAVRGFKEKLFESLQIFWITWSPLFKSGFAMFGLFTLFFLIFTTTLPSVHWYGFSPAGMRHNVGQMFSAGDLSSLQRRMGAAERDIFHLQQRGKVHDDTIHRLEGILPDVIVGTKDKFGNLVLPSSLWKALDDKIRSEHPLAFDNVGATMTGSAVAPTKEIDEQLAKSFDRFVKSNNFNAKAIDTRFSHLLGKSLSDNLILSKDEAIRLIRENWAENQAGIKAEMSKLTKELRYITQSLSKLQDGLTKSEVQEIAQGLFSKMLPNAQLSALAKANIRANVNLGLTRVNHFARGSGAIINAHLTSPNFVFPELDMSFFSRNFYRLFLGPVPIPKSPIEALTKWEEYGDCWCSPAKDANGFGPSLAVIMASSIHPEEVVIEHIQPSASLQPGSAPRELELLAYIPEIDKYEAARQASLELFPEEADSLNALPFRYVRVASFEYNAKDSENVQAFPVQLDTKAFDAHTNKLIVRAKNNWGSASYTCLYRVRVHGTAAAESPGTY